MSGAPGCFRRFDVKIYLNISVRAQKNLKEMCPGRRKAEVLTPLPELMLLLLANWL